MLKDDLYKIVTLEHLDDNIEAVLELNKDSTIFSGHFPGQSVLPGACMLQMLKEVLESGLGKFLRLKRAEQIKFLKLVDPGIEPVLKLKLSYATETGEIKVSANMSSGGTVCFKLKAVFAGE